MWVKDTDIHHKGVAYLRSPFVSYLGRRVCCLYLTTYLIIGPKVRLQYDEGGTPAHLSMHPLNKSTDSCNGLLPQHCIFGKPDRFA